VRLLMLGWDFEPQRTGGVGTACRGIVEALVELGTELTLVAPGSRASTPAAGDWRVIEVAAGAPGGVGAPIPAGAARTSIPSPHPPRGRAATTAVAENPSLPATRRVRVASPLTPYLTQASYTRAASRESGGEPDLLGEVQRFAARAVRAARDVSFDVVYAHDWMTLPAGVRIAQRTGRPLVWHVHSTEYDRAPQAPDPAIVAVEQRGLDRATRVVAVSRRTADVLATRYRVDPAKLRVVHNAVRAPRASVTGEEQRARRWERRPDRPLVLFLGRLTEQKDPGTFLRAAALAARELPAAHFVVAGGGELLPALVAEASALGLTDRVHFTGALAGEDVERMYALADVYVMSSAAEPFGIAALEAMCADVPVVVTQESGVTEVLSNALAVPAGDAGELARCVVALLEDPELRRDLIERGREEVRRLRWEVRAHALLRIFEECAA